MMKKPSPITAIARRTAANCFGPLRMNREKGMTLVEIAIGIALLGIVTTSAIAALTILNKNAVTTRVMTNAREIVQRNIESAIGSPFTTTSAPTILTLTSGSTWDEAGGSNPVVIYTSRDGTSSSVTGTLTRTVTAEANGAGAIIRRVKFQLSYTLFGRPMSYDMTTLRAVDK